MPVNKLLILSIPLVLAVAGVLTTGCKETHENQPTSQANGHLFPPGAGTTTPVVVRGGAMRFHSKQTWVPVASGSPNYCSANVNITSITVMDPSGNPVAPSFTNLQGPWTMVLQGREPFSPKSASGNGIQVSAQKSACGGIGTSSLMLSPYSNNSGFYSDDPSTDDDNSSIIRFLDNTKDPQGCQGPSNSLNGDEDVCERLLSIQLTLSAADGGTTSNWTCKNGECEIDIGK